MIGNNTRFILVSALTKLLAPRILTTVHDSMTHRPTRWPFVTGWVCPNGVVFHGPSHQIPVIET
jgi:hypothetical protein